jgi:hypothetical protein
MKRYKSLTQKDLEEASIITIGKMLNLLLNDSFDNVIVFDTSSQEECYRGKVSKISMHSEDLENWMVESWELQLIGNEPWICFNATWDY